MKINWKQKLTSRKFWAAVVGFITPILLAFRVSDSVITEVAGIIIAGGTMIAYIIGEGLIDASRQKSGGAEENGPAETEKLNTEGSDKI